MSAMSAPRASETPSIAASPATTANRTVLLPGSLATYANRAFLKGLGLRWDPEGHRWHGTASAENVRALREHFGLEIRCFGSLQAPESEARPAKVVPTPGSRPITTPTPTVVLARREFPRRVHDGSRTHVEARIAFPSDGQDEDELATPTRRFTLAEITSGLPDDSREEDERAEARHLLDLHGRVKAARAIVSQTPGLEKILTHDWQKAARFYSRFGITEATSRHGDSVEVADSDDRSIDHGVGGRKE